MLFESSAWRPCCRQALEFLYNFQEKRPICNQIGRFFVSNLSIAYLVEA